MLLHFLDRQIRNEQIFYLPIELLEIDGTNFIQSPNIIKWKWEKDIECLAIGKFVNNSENYSKLLLIDVICGRYLLKLTTQDNAGLITSRKISIVIKEDPFEKQLIEMTIHRNCHYLTESNYNLLKSTLKSNINANLEINMRNLRCEPGTDFVTVVFYVQFKHNDRKIVSATKMVKYFMQKSKRNSTFIGFQVLSIRTVICDNQCSNHGFCNNITRLCECDWFWIQDLYRFYIGDGQSDCAWDLIYVLAISIGSLIVVYLLRKLVHFMICVIKLCKFQRRKRLFKNRNYRIIDHIHDNDEESFNCK